MPRQPTGAQIIPYCPATGRVLIALRSSRVTSPKTWAPFRGRIEPGETPREAAVRELTEEAGFDGPMQIVDLPNSPFPTFVAIVSEEFPPILNWESEDAWWVTREEADALMRSTG